MKIVATVARYLLGLAFLLFGSNAFLNFIPVDPKQMPTGPAGDFSHLMNSSHWMQVVAALMVISAVLLLINRFVPLALTMLGPILVNILLFHILFHAAGIAIGLVLSLFWVLMLTRVWPSFSAILKPTPQS
jgi:uncharacterized protein YacL